MTLLRITLLLLVGLIVSPAEAQHHRHAAASACQFLFCPTQVPQARQFRASGAESGVVGHPAGCPARRFCGCGAAVRVFGTPRRDLWLAANWLRFPRASPAPGMVAARRGHVWVLEHHISGNVWMAYDANSGGHATRIHPRSLAGYTVVNPRA